MAVLPGLQFPGYRPGATERARGGQNRMWSVWDDRVGRALNPGSKSYRPLMTETGENPVDPVHHRAVLTAHERL